MVKVEMPQNEKNGDSEIQHVRKGFYAFNPQKTCTCRKHLFSLLNMGPNSDALSSLQKHMTWHASSQAGGNNYDYIATSVYY